jgi:predicted negative regulator of RcsB-dependent stress response
MASSYDLQEQEQMAQIKHFWARYGHWITWLLIAVLAAYAGWSGWKFWERRGAVEAAMLLDELDRAASANDLDRVQRVWADMQSKVGNSMQAQHAALLTARVLHRAGESEQAKQALQGVVDRSGDPGLVAVARLRLSALALEAENPAEALQWLSAAVPTEFDGLVADRRGDILLAQGQHEEARRAYQTAWEALSPDLDYRRMVEAKLNAMGVDPSGVKP